MHLTRNRLSSLSIVVIATLIAIAWPTLHGPARSGSAALSVSSPAGVSQVVPAQAEAAQPLPPLLPGFAAPAAWASAPTPRANAAAPPSVTGLAAVVVDEASGQVLFDKDAHLPLPPASLTKIATLILALEKGNLDAEVVSDIDSASMRGSSVMGLEVGDRFQLRDLVFGLMLPSGNDAALAIARQVAGSDAAFVDMMNTLLLRLDLHDSHFINPHGLGGGTQHIASAYDLAMLSRYGMSLPWFKEIVTTGQWTAKGSRTIKVANINTFLYSYAGADGIKTGYTRGAGPTLAASATRNGHRLYAVVLNSGSRDADASRLLNWAFANYDWPNQ